jgi:hypothetical protein
VLFIRNMHKPYLLLRDNKQSGPFSLDELTALGLKPHDLIWVEGQSAGWRNPSEIGSLKQIMEPQVEAIASSPVPEVQTAAAKIEKKEPATPSKKIYISLPAGRSVRSLPEVQDMEMPEELSPEEKLQKKAEELFRRAQDYAAGIKEPVPKEEPEVKYTRSLEDIKEEYSDWLRQQKKGGRRIFLKKKILIPVVAAAVLLPLAFFLPFNRSSEVSIPPVTTKNTVAEKRDPARYVTFTRKYIKKKKSKVPVKNSIAVKKKTVAASKPAIAKTSKPAKRVSMADPDLPSKVLVTSNYAGTGKNGVRPFHIKVTNNSGATLRMVAVDVKYYKRDGSLSETKTLYWSNLAPGASSSREAPGMANTARASYGLGLLSSDEGGIYYARQ